MAQGRMIVNAICMDKRVNELSSDTSRLAFTWLITFADKEGRTYGDPAAIRSMVFPRRDDISIADMTKMIQEWHDAGLIVWYQSNGDDYIYFPTFEKNQPGLRKDREAESRIPEPPKIQPKKPKKSRRSSAGVPPEQRPVNRMDIKGMESPPDGEEKTDIQIVEHLEAVFAEARGTTVPDWSNPKAANKTWRTPIRGMLKNCGGDAELTARMIEATVAKMKADGLTFTMPTQIEKTFQSMVLDKDSKASGLEGYTYVGK